MRIVFAAVLAANLLLAAVSLAVLPDRVAIHFVLGGHPDSWAPAWFNALLFAGMDGLLSVMIWLTPRWAFAFPDRWINLPNKAYWLAPERRPEAQARLARAMVEFGTALLLFMLVVSALVIKANLSDPVRLDEKPFLGALALFLVFTVFWLVRLYRTFRIPESGASGAVEPGKRETTDEPR